MAKRQAKKSRKASNNNDKKPTTDQIMAMARGERSGVRSDTRPKSPARRYDAEKAYFASIGLAKPETPGEGTSLITGRTTVYTTKESRDMQRETVGQHVGRLSTRMGRDVALVTADGSKRAARLAALRSRSKMVEVKGRNKTYTPATHHEIDLIVDDDRETFVVVAVGLTEDRTMVLGLNGSEDYVASAIVS